MMSTVNHPFFLGMHQVVKVTNTGILLPNGLSIRYPKLRLEEGKTVYYSRRGDINIWGGAVVENVVQALARIIVGEQMVKLNKHGLRPVLTVHDAAVVVVHADKLQESLDLVTQIMSEAPSWAKGLPIACEAKHGKSYGAT
jgi:DNA polymerase